MLKITDLSFSFGNHKIFENLNLDFESGKITGIVGKNGVGKTTLFRIISNIYGIQGGSITLNSKMVTPSDITFMPTEPYFYPFMKGKEYLNIVGYNAEDIEKALHYSDVLDLPLEDLVDNYSTGMKKKLAFACLFALNKPVIILDEPYNGVDLESNEIIKHIIKTFTGTKIVILSSHIISTITDVCECVFHLTDNQKVNTYHNSQFGQLYESLDKVTKDKLKNIDL